MYTLKQYIHHILHRLTRTLHHTQISCQKPRVRVWHQSEEIWVVNHSRWALSHTCAIVVEVFASLHSINVTTKHVKYYSQCISYELSFTKTKFH